MDEPLGAREQGGEILAELGGEQLQPGHDAARRIVGSGPPADLQRRIGGRMRYAISFDRLEPQLVDLVRSLEGVFSVSVDATAQTLNVDLNAGSRTLTNVLQAVTRNGVTVFGIRPLGDGLLELFRTSEET